MTSVENQMGPRVVVALDYPEAKQALEFVGRIDPTQCRLKVGKELFTLAGPQFVETLVAKGFDVFLDLKFHDIPNTVANACRAASKLGVWMMNVHALGGRRMMEAAREAVETSGPRRPHLIAVTILTSHSEEELGEIGLSGSPAENVVRLANLAQSAGVDGVVCSAQESSVLRAALGDDFMLVTPGIRPASAAVNDQKRIMTPEDAIAAGSSYLVIGRPITAAEDPAGVLLTINSAIGAI